MATIGNSVTFRREASAAFAHAYESYEPLWPKFCKVVPSLTKAEYYAWVQALPQLRTMSPVGRELVDLATYSYNITNEAWELTVAFDRYEAMDDMTGQLLDSIGKLSLRAAQYPDYLLAQLCENGGTYLAWDGSAEFADTRLSLPLATDNNISVDISNTSICTAAEGKQIIGAAVNQLASFRTEDGKTPWNMNRKFTVMTPLGHYAGLREAAVGTTLYNSVADFGGTVDVVANPWLTTATYVYVFAVGGNESLNPPFVFQKRSEVEFVLRDSPDDEVVHMKNNILASVTQRGKVWYRDPRTAVRVGLT